MIAIEDLRITTLCDNGVADAACLAEWGLSLHLSHENGMDVLLDTGGEQGLCSIIQRFSVSTSGKSPPSVSVTDIAITPEGSSRSSRIFSRCIPCGKAWTSIATPRRLEASVRQARGDSFFYRGIPYHPEELRRYGARFKTSAKPVWLNDDMVLSGEIPLQTDFEAPSESCCLKIDGGYEPSPVLDDQALFVHTSRGLLVLSGCAHRGIINTLLHAREITGQEEIHMVVGGTHLLNTTRRQQENTARMLQELQVHHVGVSHCTGHKPASCLAQRLGPERFFFNNAGTSHYFFGSGCGRQSL